MAADDVEESELSDARLLARDIVRFYEQLVFPVSEAQYFEEKWIACGMDDLLLAGMRLPHRTERPDVVLRILRVFAAHFVLPDPLVLPHSVPFAVLCLHQCVFLALNSIPNCSPWLKVQLSMDTLEQMQRCFGGGATGVWTQRPRGTNPPAWTAESGEQQFLLTQAALRTLDRYAMFDVVPYVSHDEDVRNLSLEYEAQRRAAANVSQRSRLSVRLSFQPGPRVTASGAAAGSSGSAAKDPSQLAIEESLEEYNIAVAGLLD